ncbi:MAG: Hsp20/alpha crystallin family protein [Geminicoccaceae bacterium]
MLMTYPAGGRRPDPFRELRRAQNDLGRLFGSLRFMPQAEFPPVNIWAGADGAVLKATIPGVSQDQIDITVHQNTVTLRGRREPEALDGDTVVLRQERAHGPFGRTVVLPFRVDADRAAARFAHGMLTLELPRPAADQPRRLKVASA